jgi:hypothetical protein
MHHLAGSYFRGFSNPAERTVWSWIAAFAIVALILAVLATVASEHPRMAASDGPGRDLVPPITQPTPAPPVDGDQVQL